MSLVPGPGIGGSIAGDTSGEAELHIPAHVRYIQSLDTASLSVRTCHSHCSSSGSEETSSTTGLPSTSASTESTGV